MAALPTPRLPRSSPRRQPAVPTQQLRQQAIANCLEMCKEQGFCPEEDAQPVSLGPDACQYVDAVHKLCALKADILVRQDADLYGTLCSQADLDMKAGKLNDAQAALSMVVDNQERLIAFLQQPYSGPCLTVESGSQQHVISLLQYATQDAASLTKGMDDLHWVMQFKEPSTVWTKLLQPTPHVAAIISQCHEGLAAIHSAVGYLAAGHNAQ